MWLDLSVWTYLPGLFAIYLVMMELDSDCFPCVVLLSRRYDCYVWLVSFLFIIPSSRFRYGIDNSLTPGFSGGVFFCGYGPGSVCVLLSTSLLHMDLGDSFIR